MELHLFRYIFVIRLLIFIPLSILLISCDSKMHAVSKVEPLIHLDLTHNNNIKAKDIPQVYVDKKELVYHAALSVWTLNDSLYSGYVQSHYPTGQLKQSFGVLDGKKHMQSLDWYPDQHLKFLSNYHNGKLHGEKKSWSPDPAHVLLTQLNYNMGKADGIQKEWYATGELYKILQMSEGKEEGMQQAFRKNGDLYANYEAKGGKIFGLKRAELCFGLQNELGKYDIKD